MIGDMINNKLIPYDFILMDENMPNMNGFEAIRMIRKKLQGLEEYEQIKIYLYTGYCTEEYCILASECGANGIL